MPEMSYKIISNVRHISKIAPILVRLLADSTAKVCPPLASDIPKHSITGISMLKKYFLISVDNGAAAEQKKVHRCSPRASLILLNTIELANEYAHDFELILK